MKYKFNFKRIQSARIVFRDRDQICRNIIEYGLLGLIVFSPIVAGAVYEWSTLVIQLVVLAMMMAYFLMKRAPRKNELLFRSLRWPRYLFTGLFILILIQILPLPHFLIKLFSPNSYSFQKYFLSDFSKDKFMSLSLLPSYTFREGLELLSYFLVGFLIINTVTRRRQIMRIIYVIVAMGLFQALYGFIELYSKNPRILIYKKVHYLDAVTGTFVNRNHLSGYLEMIIPLTIGIIIARIKFFSPVGSKWKERILRLSEKGFYTNVLLSLGIILMSLAIIFSKSRSGIFLLIFTFILFFELTVLYFRKFKEKQKWIKSFLKVTFLVITFFSLYIGISSTIERFALEELLREGRPEVWSNVIGIISDFPFFGSGLGTFSSLYPAYERILTPNHFSHAHSDYLEYISELGVLGFVLLFGGICFILIHSFLIWRERRHPEVKGLTLGGMIGVILILIHSISDFNLHIPANTLLFSVILSITLVTAFYKKSKNGQTLRSETKNDLKRKDSDSRKRESGKQRTILIVAALIIFGTVNILIYWNYHLYLQAKRVEDADKRIRILERAHRLYPFNDLVFYELGKSYFDLGRESLIKNKNSSKAYFLKSVLHFSRSLRVNPASSFAHFYLAQALVYFNYLVPFDTSGKQEWNFNPYIEYKKAAQLAGHNDQILYEAGKILLSHWKRLSEENRVYTLEILKRAVQKRNREKLLSLMCIWELNVKDYEVMEQILPEDMLILQIYAQFLGEKSLSRQNRQYALSKVELLEFKRAKDEFKRGENLFLYSRYRDAFQHYKCSVEILENLKYFQNIIKRKMIDPDEVNALKKSNYLKLAKCYIEQDRDLKEAGKYLNAYLDLEGNKAELSELEAYLIDRDLIEDKLTLDLDDFEKLSLQIFLYFKQNRYREIIKVGNLLKESFIVVPDSKKKDYVEVLQLIGDSYQKIDYLYDAAEFYQMALDVDPENLGTLLRLRRNYDRLNEEEKIRILNRKIDRLLSPRRIYFRNSPIDKGKNFSQTLMFDGSRITLKLHFRNIREETAPLISIFFNRSVVWEDYLKEDILILPLETRMAENNLVIRPINRSVDLTGLRWTTD